MSFVNLKPKFAFAVFLLQGVLGTPVSTTINAGTPDATPTPTSIYTASSPSSSTLCNRSICWDGVNECGMMYGGCFLDPACTGGSAFPTFSKPPCPTSKSVSSSSACTQSICADYINECGMPYGGCFLDPHCTGGTAFPTFSKPECPTSITATPTASSSASATCTRSICVDNVNECGMPYGGCFLDPVCTGGTAWPTFSKPSCPTSSSSTCLDAYSSNTRNSTVPTSSAKPTCSHSICVDGIDECGQGWGGCYLAPECGGPKTEPTFSKPYCSPTVSPTAVIIETVTRYTSIPLVTVTKTSTSLYPVKTVTPVPSAAANSTYINNTPTPTPSPVQFTGAGVRNVVGAGFMAAAIAVGAVFL